MGRKYDVIIYGATGFTGKCTVKELLKLMKAKKIEKLTWAVGGRSSKKLKETLKQLSAEMGEDLSSVDVIEADTGNAEALQAMARQCSVVITCVGPYRFYGEPVIKACVAESTHCVDVSGEPQYLEKIQLKYHEEAASKNIYIVGSCGLDSIPTDCGVTLLQEKFDGDVNGVEMYIEVENKGPKSTKLNVGTWKSLIYGLAHAKELRELRQQLCPKRLPTPSYKLPERGLLHYSESVKGWCLPFPGADRSVVKRSQYYFFHEEQKRPTQMVAYVKLPSLFASLLLMSVAFFFGVLAQFRIGRYFLEKYPRLFSFGTVTENGMSEDEMENVHFKVSLFGEGWKDKLPDPVDQHSEAPNKKMAIIVKGKNPGYGATCIMVIQSAYTILKESDKMPSKGGAFTPGVAFANTTLIDRLNDSGVTFTVEDKSA